MKKTLGSDLRSRKLIKKVRVLPCALGVTSSLQFPAVCEVIRDLQMRSW